MNNGTMRLFYPLYAKFGLDLNDPPQDIPG